MDLVEREDQITFEIGLDDEVDKEEMLDVFRVDPDFEQNEAAWAEIKKEILGGGDDDDDEVRSNCPLSVHFAFALIFLLVFVHSQGDGEGEGEYGGGEGGGGDGGEGEEEAEVVEESRGPMTITDMTDQDLVNLRRTVRIWPSLKNALSVSTRRRLLTCPVPLSSLGKIVKAQRKC